MALYDRELTRSFFSEIAHQQDVCVYCEKAINQKRTEGKLDRDETIKEHKLLRGKLTGRRVMKFRYLGHELCVCPECVNEINKEINPVIIKPLEQPNEPVNETVIEPALDTDKVDKSKNKGKSNASK